jgi:hypothetical protein
VLVKEHPVLKSAPASLKQGEEIEKRLRAVSPAFYRRSHDEITALAHDLARL